MLTRLRCFFLVLLGAVLFAGCCANDSCACEDSRADALYLRFKVGSGPDAFRRDEVDTVVLLRYPLPRVTTPRPPRDSITLIRTAAQAEDFVVLNNNAPFVQANGRRLNGYEYRIQLVERSKGVLRVTQTYDLREILLRGQFEGDGCCTCYRNTHKSAEVDGVPTGNLSETARQPVPIELIKR